MSVGKIFKILIIIVACVIVGAIVLNVLLPNVMVSMVNAVEAQIFNATGMSVDFNGDGTNGRGSAATATTGTIAGSGASTDNNGASDQSQAGEVNGFN